MNADITNELWIVDKEQIRSKQPHEGHPVLERALPRFLQVSLPLQPDRALVHPGANPQHQQRRNHPGPEHHAPPERGPGCVTERVRHRVEDRVDVGEGQRRQDVAPVPPPLQESRRQPPQPGSASARAPAASPPPTPRPSRCQTAPGTRTASCRRWEKPLRNANSENQRIDSISGSLRPHRSAITPAPNPPTSRNISVTVPSAPRQRRIDRKAGLDVDQDERHDGEVEPVEQPAEERGEKRPPLLPVDLAKPGRVGFAHSSAPSSLDSGYRHQATGYGLCGLRTTGYGRPRAGLTPGVAHGFSRAMATRRGAARGTDPGHGCCRASHPCPPCGRCLRVPSRRQASRRSSG